MTNLSGKTALVTGGGRGIGEATALALAACGAQVLVSARTSSEIERVAAELVAAGHQAFALPCDVGDPASVAALVATVNERFGGVDVLVNNAGIASSAPLHRISLEEWNRIFAVNVTGLFLLTQAFVPGMVKRGWGRVINIASIAGRSGAAYIAHYSASKHAVLGFTRSVAAETAAHGVTVNAICPGYVDTPMTTESVDRVVAKTGRSADEARASILKMNPQGRLIESDEVAALCVYLTTDAARGINGQALSIDGGSLLC